MKNNTKKVLACLIAGTVAVGVKYKLEQIESEKKKKNKKVRRLQLQNKDERTKTGRYIKINNISNTMMPEKGNEKQNQEVKENVQLKKNEENKSTENNNTEWEKLEMEKSSKEISEIETIKEETINDVFKKNFEEEDSLKIVEIEADVDEEMQKFNNSKQNMESVEINEKEEPATVAVIEEEEEDLDTQEIEMVSLEEIYMEQIAVTEETTEEQLDTETTEVIEQEADIAQTDVIEESIPVMKKTEKEDYSEKNTEDIEVIKEETVDLEDAKKILKRKINWQEAEGVKTEIDYSRLPAAAVLNVSELSLPEIKSLFTIKEITDEIFKRIYGKSYKTDCILPRSELRYLRMLYYGFDDKTHVGEMIVNATIAEDIRDIFYLLYQEQYQIERMVLVDNYGADDILSMAANNTSGFNYRKIDGMSVMSKHSRGLAVDINPKYNPYIRTINGEINCQPQSGEPFMDREKIFPHKIDHEDLCYCLFRTYGFAWGGDWEEIKDYQHFQKQC